MQGFVNRAIQCFVRDIYGEDRWRQVVDAAQLGFTNFEAMLNYDPAVTERVLDALQDQLGTPRAALLEDLGTYLVSDRNMEALRRLLRFGGSDFEEFLLSLDELPDKARLALPEFSLPSISVSDIGGRHYLLNFGDGLPGFSFVMMGILRAMSDDYGALALFEHRMGDAGPEILVILADASFAAGRDFSLSPVGAVING